MSTISAGTTLTTSLVNTGDTTGQLVFQTNGTTTALTLGTDQSATFAGNVVVNGSIAIPSPFAVTGNSTAGAEIRLPEDTDNGSNYVALKAPNSLASNLTLTLPSADGTNGQVLQTNGSGTLSFATPSSGALVLLSTTNVTGNPTTIDITSGFSSTYSDYLLVYSNLFTSTTDDLKLRFFKNSTIVTSLTYSSELTRGASSNTGSSAQGAENRIDLSGQPSTTDGAHGILYILGTDLTRVVGIGQTGVLGSAYYVNNITFANNASGTFSGLRFFTVSGTATFSSGVFRLYGIAK